MNNTIALRHLKERINKMGYKVYFQTRRTLNKEPLNIPFKNRETTCIGISMVLLINNNTPNDKAPIACYGKTYCSSADAWDKNFGRLTALRRAFRKLIGRQEVNHDGKLLLGPDEPEQILDKVHLSTIIKRELDAEMETELNTALQIMQNLQ